MENPETPNVENPETPTVETPQGWKTGLSTDLQNSPLLQKFEDTPEGLGKAFESHVNLEKLLGNEKIPIPKGADDKEGWARFNKAMGVPDDPNGYELGDVELPESMKDITIDKGKFSEVVHKMGLTPGQAKGLWDTYTEINKESYQRAQESLNTKLDEAVNKLRADWGDAYDTKIELGQMVINKFGGDQEGIDYLTSVLSTDPKGAKFLAKIGDQFSENKIGEFKQERFSVSPDEAQAEIDKLSHDINGPYMNLSGKFTEREHQAAVERVNSLRASILRSKGKA